MSLNEGNTSISLQTSEIKLTKKSSSSLTFFISSGRNGEVELLSSCASLLILAIKQNCSPKLS